MKCIFCNKDCEVDKDATDRIVVTEVCHNHPHSVRHYYFRNQKACQVKLSYEFTVMRNDTHYNFTFYHVNLKANLRLEIWSGDYREPWNKKPIIEFDYLPNITPENAHEKLPTILTFL